MGERSSVAAPASAWRGAFLILFVSTFVVRWVIACLLSPFGDEAFYWQESLSPAWGYSDLPPMTAWLIGISELVFGHGLFAMRLPFLLIGAVIPWQVRALARTHGGDVAGWQAGMLALCLPLAGSLGVLALPDVPLTFAILLAAQGLANALDRDGWNDWIALGLGLALAWATHYRAAMAMLAGLVFLLATPRGRACWRNSGLWLALGIATLGLVPILLYNLQSHGAGVAFQLVERNPWSFHADALVQPLEQAIACTPLAWVVLLWSLWRAWVGRERAPGDLVAVIAGTFIIGYFVLGLFADDLRFRAHWPLPGYLLLCAVLPAQLAGAGRAWRRFAVVGFALAFAGLCGGFVYLGLAASTDGARVLANAKAFPSNFTGWRESGTLVRNELLHDSGALVVADNFMLAAELRFELGGPRAIYSLDSPLNVKHGRAPQLASWRLDESALHGQAGKRLLLAVDETALRERETKDWLDSICSRVEIIRPLARADLFDGRRRIALYEARARAARSDAGPPDQCIVWMAAWRASSR